MSKITNDGLTRSGTGCFLWLYPYVNSGRQSVNRLNHQQNDVLSSSSW